MDQDKVGEWWYGIRCASCNRPIPLAAADPPDFPEIKFPDSAQERDCPWCGHTNNFNARQAQRYNSP